MSPTTRIGLPGLFLLLCASFLIKYRLDLQPLLGTVPNPETPNLTRSEIVSHLQLLLGLATLSTAGALLSFTLAALLSQLTPKSARLATLAGWSMRLIMLGLLVFLLVNDGAALVQGGLTSGGERAFMLILLTLLAGLPVTILTWTALNRLARWTQQALSWDGTRAGSLQRLYRSVNSSWRLLAVLLLGAGLWLLPLALMDIPHPKAETVSTLLDRMVIAQQKPLLIVAMISLISAGLSVWFTRQALAERTAMLDQSSSRIAEYLNRQTTPG